MNKTLLLILCDFLLLTILSMWRMEEDAPAASGDASSDAAQQESVSSMAMMEQDLLDTLQYSLEEQEQKQQEIAQSLEEREALLQETKEELAARESRIDSLEDNLTEAERLQQELAQERANLSQEVAEQRASYAVVTEQLADVQQRAQQSETQSRVLQEELQRKLAEISEKESALAEKEQQLNQTQSQVQELNVKVQMAEQQNRYLQDSVSTLQSTVIEEREERQRVQAQAGKLAEGVTQLAENSQNLREEIRSNTPINANQLFSDYKDNQIYTRFTSVKYMRNRYVETTDNASTILVSDGEQTYALMHVESGPFTLNSNPALIRSISFDLARRGQSLDMNRLQFLALDPRVVAIPLTSEQAARIGGSVYLTALEPYKFPEAVLIDKNGENYGEVRFEIDPDAPGYLKMPSKIFSSLFKGEFGPSTGDLVMSKTGELLGVMVNRRFCVLINHFVSAGSVELDGVIDRDAFERTLSAMKNQVNALPSSLR